MLFIKTAKKILGSGDEEDEGADLEDENVDIEDYKKLDEYLKDAEDVVSSGWMKEGGVSLLKCSEDGLKKIRDMGLRVKKGKQGNLTVVIHDRNKFAEEYNQWTESQKK